METCNSKRILPKLVYLLKRQLDEWKDTSLCCAGQDSFNRSHLPIFMSIGTEGISNNELAANLNITKQGASKVIKELEELNLVRSETSSADARAVILYLTDDGIRFYGHIKNQMEVLETQYKKLVGAKNYEIAIDVMEKLINFHEEQSKIVMN